MTAAASSNNGKINGDNDIVKLRPRVVLQERERLYDDVMKQRIETNALRNENTKIRTRLHMVENELTRKDRVIDDLIAQADSNGKRLGGTKLDSHLVNNLKRKVRDQQAELA